MLLNRRVERNDGMSPGILAPREADVTHDADQPSTRHERAETMRPYLVELGQELVVALDVPHLPVRLAVFLEGPIGRRGQDQVEAIRLQVRHVAGVADA